MKTRLLILSLVAFGMLTSSPPGVSAAPVWNLDIHHNETNFPPGGTAEYWFDIDNVGDADSSGTITLTVNLPPGALSLNQVTHVENPLALPEVSWSCPGSPGITKITCTTTGVIPRHSLSRRLILSVFVAPGASGDRFASAIVKGGGAADPASAVELTHISPDPAQFGIVDDSFKADFYDADGKTPERRSGAHPDLATFSFDFNSIATPTAGQPWLKFPVENVRNLQVDLPPGFLGNPTAVGECLPVELAARECPLSSQVGRFDGSVTIFSTTSFTQMSTPVFNMAHPKGYVTDLAFIVNGNPVHVKASLDPANNYSIRTTVSDINETLPPFHQKFTVWGVPADPSHDWERCTDKQFIETNVKCPIDIKPKPFLTTPSQCEADHAVKLSQYDSWQSTGAFGPEIVYQLPGQTNACEAPRFEPTVKITPTGVQANTPTGLDVTIQIPQNENPNALNTAPVKSTVVTLPEGMSFSPAFADGLQSCTQAQMGLFTNDPVKCPDASRIGEIRLSTPLLPQDAVGSIYLAAQGDNPFHSTFAMYMAIEDTEERGALIKIPGRIDVDPASGRITTAFNDLPQFPFDEFSLKFRSGPRAPLVNPPACGAHRIGIEVASYAQPTNPVDASSTYQVTGGPNGTACPSDAAGRPFAPRFSGGTVSSSAGSYTPFLFRLTRDDSEQELAQVKAVLPRGLVARIASIPFCSEAAIASISEAEGAGASELQNPACPSASQVGTLSAGLGAGPNPSYFDGKVYLAGPYKGAPLSLAVVAPGIAGPFDLGNVMVRAAIHVDPETAQVTAVSDPFPAMLHGVILRVRDVRLRVNRDRTTINPTSCEPMSVEGQITGVGGSLLSTSDDFFFTTSSPFQVGECASLAFEPKLAFRLFGGTKRGAHPKLRAVVRMPEGGANIARASVALPPSEFLDQSHIRTVCTRVQFAAGACPAASVYGKVEAKTPLLDEVLSGSIYLRSSDNLLPDLVATLRGGRIDANLVGRIDSARGGIRNTFDFVPDVPVSWAVFTFQGGKKGLLENSRDLCRGTYRVIAKLSGHNGARKTLRPKLQSSCKNERRARDTTGRSPHSRSR